MINSKRKGDEYERKVAGIINRYFGLEDKQRLQRIPMSGATDFSREDISSPQKNFFTEQFWIECKKREAGNIYNWYWTSANKKAIGNRKVPIVIHSRNNEKDFVTLLLDDFLYLVSFLRDLG